MSKDFNGTTDIISCGSAATLDNLAQGAMTIMAWIFPDTTGEGGSARIAEKRSQVAGFGGWIFNMVGTASFESSTILSGASNAKSTAVSNALTLGAWNHVALTYDDAGDRKIRLYVNGVEVTYALQTPGTATPGTDADGNFLIGNEPGTIRTFDGKIAYVTALNTVLSAAQIAVYMNRPYAPIHGTSTLKGHWPLGEDIASTARDHSGNGNHGTVTGTVVAGEPSATWAPPPSFVNKATNRTPDGAHATSVAVTIPATTEGNDLVVMVSNGDDPDPAASVLSVAATGATFTQRVAVSNTVGTDHANAECWIARNVPAGITTVTVTWAATTVGVVNVIEYADVGSLGNTATATGTAADPTISLATQDANNVMVAGFTDEATAQSTFSVPLVGILRGAAYGLGDGNPDVPGCTMENALTTPGSLTCTIQHAATDGAWAAVAVELRSVAAGLEPPAGVLTLTGAAPSRVVGTVLRPAGMRKGT